MIKKIVFALLFALMLVPAGRASALYEDYALADGTVTEKKAWSPLSDINKFCYLSYKVTLDGKEYEEKDTGDTHDFCHLEAGDTLKIKYLKSDPRKHVVASEFEIGQMTVTESEIGWTTTTEPGSDGSVGPNPLVFIAPFAVVFVIVFVIIMTNAAHIGRVVKDRLSDVDGDGLANDNKPATAEQKKLIQEGFRKLGVYHDVKKRMTQAQARETLREIDRQLKQK